MGHQYDMFSSRTILEQVPCGSTLIIPQVYVIMVTPCSYNTPYYTQMLHVWNITYIWLKFMVDVGKYSIH